MDKEFYDKYGKELDCKSCIGLQECSTNSNIPLCDKGYRRFAKDKIADLETELAEKDKEIERLNTIKNNAIECADLFKVALSVRQKDLAMQELEKVKDTLKHFCEIHSDEFYGVKSQVKGIEQDVCEEIDNQIKVLKGE